MKREAKMGDEKVPYTAIDPGIRETVRWLNGNGFRTTDSGDGVSKAELIAEGYALDMPHVFMPCDPSELVFRSTRLRQLLNERGLKGVGRVEATYSPDDGVAVLALYDVNDEILAAAER